MSGFFRTIDGLLRGAYTSAEALRGGRVAVSARKLALCGLVLGACYGLFMGLYAALRGDPSGLLQLAMTTAKVPFLFLLTLLVTLPSLYVFSALAGSRLSFHDTLRLLLVGIVIDLALLASFGPVTGFFTLSTESYPFMILLNVLFFAVAGFVGLAFMRRALEGIVGVEETAPSGKPLAVDAPSSTSDGETPDDDSMAAPPSSAADRWRAQSSSAERASRARSIFIVWTFIYGSVGAQMGWILRPFIGSPELPVTLFRNRSSNFFEAVLRTIGDLFS